MTGRNAIRDTTFLANATPTELISITFSGNKLDYRPSGIAKHKRIRAHLMVYSMGEPYAAFPGATVVAEPTWPGSALS
jgi:hypothetical protein